MDNYERYELFAKDMEESYPKMFSENYGGFAIGEGWFRLVKVLCDNIQSYFDWKKENDSCKPVVVKQVKEKFGGLRFYYSGGDDYVAGLVCMAEALSNYTCEVCGKPGIPGSSPIGWVRTLCEDHDKEEAKLNDGKI